VRDNSIDIHEKIQFEVNKATIKPESFGLLDEIVKVIKENAYIKKIQIEGHASAEGDAKHNMKFSDERAKAVRKYLVDHGVEADHLIAKGFGITKPLASNDTEEGKEKNRRVEFNILEQDVTKRKVEIDPATGKEKLIEETKTTVSKPVADDAKPEAKDVKKDAKVEAKDAKKDVKKDTKDVKKDTKVEAKDVKKDTKVEAKDTKSDNKANSAAPSGAQK
jgi:OOP family OmpA-OmpF porin